MGIEHRRTRYRSLLEFKERIRQGLERDLSSDEMRKIFDQLEERHPVLKRFVSPVELVKAMHERKIESYRERDGITAALIGEYQENPDLQILRSFLSLLFWPAIDHIFNSKKGQVQNKQELWSEVYWAFLNTILRYPLFSRPKKIAMNVKLDTLSKVCRWQKDESKYRKAIALFASGTEPGELAGEVRPREIQDPGKASDEWTEKEIGRAQIFLQRFVDEGVITEADYYLILGTRVYGAQLKQYALDHGLSPEAAKKRRQRAEKAIREYLEAQEKNPDSSVP